MKSIKQLSEEILGYGGKADDEVIRRLRDSEYLLIRITESFEAYRQWIHPKGGMGAGTIGSESIARFESLIQQAKRHVEK